MRMGLRKEKKASKKSLPQSLKEKREMHTILNLKAFFYEWARFDFRV